MPAVSVGDSRPRHRSARDPTRAGRWSDHGGGHARPSLGRRRQPIVHGHRRQRNDHRPDGRTARFSGHPRPLPTQLLPRRAAPTPRQPPKAARRARVQRHPRTLPRHHRTRARPAPPHFRTRPLRSFGRSRARAAGFTATALARPRPRASRARRSRPIPGSAPDDRWFSASDRRWRRRGGGQLRSSGEPQRRIPDHAGDHPDPARLPSVLLRQHDPRPPDQQLTEAALDELLAELEALVPPTTNPAPTPATDVNVVDQTTTQFQDGSGGDGQSAVGGQAQTATQTAGTVQILPSSPTAQLEAIGMGDPSVATMLNQTHQGIWQLQIGCVFDCSQTQQDQQAEQSSSSVQVILPLPGGATTTASAANSATALIWQFQVGCLLWCYDAVEVQTASSDQSSIVIVPTPPPPPPPVTGGTPDPSGQTPPSGSSPGSAPTSTSTSGPATVASPGATP